LNELLDSLKECFHVTSLLKSEIISGEFKKNDDVLTLISKINDLEFFVLQNELYKLSSCRNTSSFSTE